MSSPVEGEAHSWPFAEVIQRKHLFDRQRILELSEFSPSFKQLVALAGLSEMEQELRSPGLNARILLCSGMDDTHLIALWFDEHK